MKQSVIFKSVLFAMVSLPLLTACTDDSSSSVGNVSNELKLNVGIATPQKPDFVPAISRVTNPTGATIYTWSTTPPYSTNPTSFASGTDIGIFVRRASDEGPYGFVTWNTSGATPVAQISGQYDNLKYTSTGSALNPPQIWNYSPTGSAPSVFLPGDIDGKLCAYYPYDANLTYDGNSYTYDATYGAGTGPYPLVVTSTVGTGQPAATDYFTPSSGWYIDCSAGIDYMYCPQVGGVGSAGNVLNATYPLVNIVMHHAQACLKFKVSVPSTFSGTADLTKFKVYGGFAMKAYTDIWDPGTSSTSNYTVVLPPGATADTIKVEASGSAVLQTLSPTSAYECAYFCVPINEFVPTNLYIECDIDGHTYRATISSINLLREWIYEIPLILTQGQLVVNEVTINPWTINSSIPVTPLL
jgi:hypothetical protein